MNDSCDNVQSWCMFMTATGRYGDDNTELSRCRSTPQLNTYLYVIICNIIVIISWSSSSLSASEHVLPFLLWQVMLFRVSDLRLSGHYCDSCHRAVTGQC